MPHERPDAKELIEAVTEFLTERVVPSLPGQGGFHARVAANGLTIALRELEQGPALTAQEQTRLQSILGHNGEADVLNTELVENIRAGKLPADRSELLAHLRATVRDKLLISNPKYLLPEDRPETI
jgi:Domain of unknown function (DUF6285)